MIFPDTARFLSYTRPFGTEDPRYELKRVHTLGVLGYMNALLDLESVEPELHRAARLTALYHDIGRFEQLRRYGTFFDRDSEDHAALSVRVLEEEGLLEGEPLKPQILEAIGQHSRLAIDLKDPVSRRLCALVRDADKLDILRVFATDDIQDVTSHSLKEACEGQAAEAVVQALLAGKPVRKEDRRSAIDIWLTYLGFVNDFQFPSAYRLCEKAGFWKRRFSQNRFRDPVIQTCVQHAEEVLHENSQ